ncbi:MAG: hypothetical protein HYZ71_08165 [Deltaproteobacteria bacterium]|nr:hypothetical protein [Deltaproteobacteria bacterium]
MNRLIVVLILFSHPLCHADIVVAAHERGEYIVAYMSGPQTLFVKSCLLVSRESSARDCRGERIDEISLNDWGPRFWNALLPEFVGKAVPTLTGVSARIEELTRALEEHEGLNSERVTAELIAEKELQRKLLLGQRVIEARKSSASVFFEAGDIEALQAVLLQGLRLRMSKLVPWAKREEACDEFGEGWRWLNEPAKLSDSSRWGILGRHAFLRVWNGEMLEGQYKVTCGVRLPPPNDRRILMASVWDWDHYANYPYQGLNYCRFKNGLATGEQLVEYLPTRAGVTLLQERWSTSDLESVEQGRGVPRDELLRYVVCERHP